MIKMVFSDFDQTLLNYHSDKNYFDDYQVGVLKRLYDKGIKFCIVTGRNALFFNKFDNILPYVSYIISSNGACIYDVLNKNIIYRIEIEKEAVSYLLDYVNNNGYGIFYNSNGVQHKDISNLLVDSCEQVIISFNKVYLESVLDDIKNLDGVNYSNICRHWDRYTIDVNDEVVSKGDGIKYLCDYIGIELEDTIGFGDSDNDISMFDVVGKSIAVANAIDKVKDNASTIILSCDDNGVFRYIEEEILK